MTINVVTANEVTKENSKEAAGLRICFFRHFEACYVRFFYYVLRGNTQHIFAYSVYCQKLHLHLSIFTCSDFVFRTRCAYIFDYIAICFHNLKLLERKKDGIGPSNLACNVFQTRMHLTCHSATAHCN